MPPLRAVAVIGEDIADVARGEMIRAYCDRRGYILTALAADIPTAVALQADGRADVIVLGSRSWLTPEGVEVVTQEMPAATATARRALGAAVRRPQRLRLLLMFRTFMPGPHCNPQ